MRRTDSILLRGSFRGFRCGATEQRPALLAAKSVFENAIPFDLSRHDLRQGGPSGLFNCAISGKVIRQVSEVNKLIGLPPQAIRDHARGRRDR